MIGQHAYNSPRLGITDYILRSGASPVEPGIGMLVVLFLRHYFQIFGAVVGLNTVAMIDGHSLRDWADESLSNQRVYTSPKFLALQAKDDLKIARLGVKAWLHKARLSIYAPFVVVAQVVRPHAALVTDFVSRKPFYRLPNFARIVFRHLDNSLSRCLEPFAALIRCNGSLISYQLDSKVAIWGT